MVDQALRLGAGIEERPLDPNVKPQRLWLPRWSRGGLSVGCSGVVREQGAVLPRGSDQLGERLDHVPPHRGEDLRESAHPRKRRARRIEWSDRSNHVAEVPGVTVGK